MFKYVGCLEQSVRFRKPSLLSGCSLGILNLFLNL